MQKKVIVDDAVIYAPRPTQEMWEDTSSYTKVCFRNTPVVEDDKHISNIKIYAYISKKSVNPLSSYNYSVYEIREESSNNPTKRYVGLTGYFMYNYEKVSCYDISVTKKLKDYEEITRDTSGNGTKKQQLP